MKYYFRAIGDESLKPYLSTDCDITTVQLLPTDDFFILGSNIFLFLLFLFGDVGVKWRSLNK